MAEHDGVGPADPHPSRTERPHASFTPGDHDLVGADRPRLERRPDPLRVGWTAPRSPRTCLPAPPSSGWLRCLHHPPHPSAPSCPYLWPDPVPSALLVCGAKPGWPPGFQRGTHGRYKMLGLWFGDTHYILWVSHPDRSTNEF